MVDRIKALCKLRGTTIKAVERDCGLGNGTIAKWDHSSPSYDKLLAVADRLGVETSYITGEKEKAHPQIEDELNNWFRNLVGDLTSDELEKVAAYIQGLKANRKV